jgi:Domain of unknown function (DUF6048)
MLKTLSCIISILLTSVCCFAQQPAKTDTALQGKIKPDTSNHLLPAKADSAALKDSIITVQHALRLGVDISRFAMPYLQPNRRDYEVSADMQIRQNLYGVLEGGYDKVNIEKPDLLIYNSDGYFFRVGVDYNFLPPSFPREKNIIYGGIRLGHAQMKQQAPFYQITDSVWGNVDGSISPQNLSANWLEFVVGIKVELLKKFFMGWSVRARALLSRNIINQELPPYVIPGFGKGATAGVFDFNYSVYYSIPLFSSKEKIKKKRPPPKKPH